ncbi:hypothetical protein NQ176_g1976 [Zarea fungicola]|uniref:Uncharacterized protein n=1 Tax=Zarea fungicola TaxID=93591 RepID=A0ACC1NT46_9HYPO|nr:hypothetical protein NQ176_g1976 [Lecanicillium fungicola]
MESLDLPLLYLISDVMSELKHHVPVDEKPFAEYLILKSLKGSCKDNVRKRLGDIGADFPPSFLDSLDRLAHAIGPQCKSERNSGSETKDGLPGGTTVSSYESRQVCHRSNTTLAPWDEMSSHPRKQTQQKRTRSDADSIESRRKRRKRSPSEDRWRHDLYSEGSISQDSDYSSSTDEDSFRRRSRASRSREPSQTTKETERSQSPYHQVSSPGRNSPQHSPTQNTEVDDKPQLFKIYRGHVRGVTDYGAFIRLHGVHGQVDGLLHISRMINSFVRHPSEILKHSQQVWVKVKEVHGHRAELSMVEVDQHTGKDLKPQQPQQQQQNSSRKADDALERAKMYSRMNSDMILSRDFSAMTSGTERPASPTTSY